MKGHIGVTASREGLTEIQRLRAKSLLSGWEVLHHGDCVGGDDEIDGIARLQGIRIVAHPPSDAKLRAYCKSSEERQPKEYLARNRDIVDESEILVAFPNTPFASPHSGTWYTIGYARKMNKPLVIVFPNGDAEFERCSE